MSRGAGVTKRDTIRLKYLPYDQTDDSMPAQPCTVALEGRIIRVVPIVPLHPHDCELCIGSGNEGHVWCEHIPDCANAVYVRATPANKLKYITWLLNQNN